MDHLPTDSARLSQIAFTYYDGGHMMYTNTESLAKLSADLRAFVLKR
ncbi:MAG: hypothetical protein ACR2OZ_06920 [Verrucomicrobiales bacterium]